MANIRLVQVEFMLKVREMIPPHHSMVDEIADLLNVSTDSAYRRIRGETALSLEEVIKLCNHYKISFDSFNNNVSGTVTFNYQPLGTDVKSFDNYLKGILTDLKKIKHFEKRQLLFAAMDIPVFHHFSFPELTAFKIFYWNKTILNTPSLEGKKFNISLVDKSLMAVSKEIIQLYQEIPSVEIWTEDTINSTLKQIEFYWDEGLFSGKEDALLIFDQLEAMLKKIMEEAKVGKKLSADGTKHAEYKLFSTELMMGNNCILVSMDNVKAVYLSHQTFNAMITTNISFSNETEEWFRNLITKSVLISGEGERQRKEFFNKIFANLNRVKEKMK